MLLTFCISGGVTEEFLWNCAFYFLKTMRFYTSVVVLAKSTCLVCGVVCLSQGSTDLRCNESICVLLENFLRACPVDADAGPTASAE